MIEVKTKLGWMPFCDENVATGMVDMNGIELFTGDVVEVVELLIFKDGTIEIGVIDTSMVLFDQHKRILTTDKVFVGGWFNRFWDCGEPDDCHIRKVDRSSLKENSRYRIV